MLQEYNQLFKRKEQVELKHKWLSDEEDARADIAASPAASEDSEEKRKTFSRKQSQG